MTHISLKYNLLFQKEIYVTIIGALKSLSQYSQSTKYQIQRTFSKSVSAWQIKKN